MPGLATNVLSYGDNLDILRRYLPDAAIDWWVSPLFEVDPPVPDGQLLEFYSQDLAAR
jgi:hypothetical protein